MKKQINPLGLVTAVFRYLAVAFVVSLAFYKLGSLEDSPFMAFFVHNTFILTLIMARDDYGKYLRTNNSLATKRGLLFGAAVIVAVPAIAAYTENLLAEPNDKGVLGRFVAYAAVIVVMFGLTILWEKFVRRQKPETQEDNSV
ncbi:MAG TPA: hypothetical protein VF809_03405 [Candidatus Saccharimonadales bacterium]